MLLRGVFQSIAVCLFSVVVSRAVGRGCWACSVCVCDCPCPLSLQAYQRLQIQQQMLQAQRNVSGPMRQQEQQVGVPASSISALGLACSSLERLSGITPKQLKHPEIRSAVHGLGAGQGRAE